VADYTGSFSGSFEGNGNGLTNVDYYNLSNLPTTITPFQRNSISANNAFRDNFAVNVKERLNIEGIISSSAQLTTEFDLRYGNEEGDNLISGSSQVDFDGISNVPSGLISSSAQITITESQISDLTHFTSADVRGVMNTDSVVSSSAQVIQHLPSGTVSSSNQITISESQISDLTHTDVSSLNNFTSSVVLNSVTSSMSVATASFISDTFISESAARSGFGQGGGTSDYDELINVPSGIISSSAQITALGYSTTDNDNQTLSISGQTLTISAGNSVILPSAGGGGGSSIWTTGSQDPEAYTHLMTSNNLQVTGSFDVLGDLTVNGKSIFTQTSASDNESAVVVNGRIKILEQQIEGYIASASIQIGNTRDSIDCGGFF
jgi:hypothetical protein